MKITKIIPFVATAAAYDHGSTYGGSGPFKSYYFEDASLPNHTIYQPLVSAVNPGTLKLPVIVWGNGGCDVMGLKFRNFLGEVASHGAFIIATGPAFVDPETWTDSGNVTTDQNPEYLTQAMDWITSKSQDGKDGRYSHIDPSRLAVWGQSCGGLEAYSVRDDPRLGHLGIYDSGELTAAASRKVAGDVEVPIFYFMGGEGDIAYENAERDWTNLPPTTAAWKAQHNLGHSEAFDDPNAGVVGVAGTRLMQWLLRGEEGARSWFFDGEAGYGVNFTDLTTQNMDGLKTPSPLGV